MDNNAQRLLVLALAGDLVEVGEVLGRSYYKKDLSTEDLSSTARSQAEYILDVVKRFLDATGE